MKQYIYVLVVVSSDHNARSVVIAGENEFKGLSLSKVLAYGWVPVRETPMGGSGNSYCSLVLLEREGGASPAPSASERSAEMKVAPAKKPAAPKAEAKPKAAPAPAAAPAPVAMSEDEGLDMLADEPPTSPPPKKEKEKEGAKPASDSDVSFDFLESLED